MPYMDVFLHGINHVQLTMRAVGVLGGSAHLGIMLDCCSRHSRSQNSQKEGSEISHGGTGAMLSAMSR